MLPPVAVFSRTTSRLYPVTAMGTYPPETPGPQGDSFPPAQMATLGAGMAPPIVFCHADVRNISCAEAETTQTTTADPMKCENVRFMFDSIVIGSE